MVGKHLVIPLMMCQLPLKKAYHFILCSPHVSGQNKGTVLFLYKALALFFHTSSLRRKWITENMSVNFYSTVYTPVWWWCLTRWYTLLRFYFIWADIVSMKNVFSEEAPATCLLLLFSCSCHFFSSEAFWMRGKMSSNKIRSPVASY